MKTNLIAIVALIFTVNLYAQSGSQWEDKTYAVEGQWSLEAVNGQYVLKLGSDFKTLAGPELSLYLSPLDIKAIGDRDAVDKKGAILIGALKSNKGAQQYSLPTQVDPSQYKSLVIYCPKFSVVWGGVAIE